MLDLLLNRSGSVYKIMEVVSASAAAQDLFTVRAPSGIAVVVHDLQLAKDGAGTNALSIALAWIEEIRV